MARDTKKIRILKEAAGKVARWEEHKLKSSERRLEVAKKNYQSGNLLKRLLGLGADRKELLEASKETELQKKAAVKTEMKRSALSSRLKVIKKIEET